MAGAPVRRRQVAYVQQRGLSLRRACALLSVARPTLRFLFDACANGQQLKCLTVIDEYTRECLAIDVAGSIRSTRVFEVLSKLVTVHGAPRYLRSDNGPEFISRAILRWLTEANIDTACIDPGKP